MRMVYTPSLMLVFQPNVPVLQKLLPDVSTITYHFSPVSSGNRTDPHLASEIGLVFKNRNSLRVPGYTLWKFRDMVLPGLGSDESGYLDSNPYTDDYAENLARRIRAAYDASFVDGRPWDAARPIIATVFLGSGAIDTRYRAKISGPPKELLHKAAIDEAPTFDKDFLLALRTLVADEVSRPRFELGFTEVGGGLIGRKPMESAWPDLSTVTFKAFRMMLSRKTHADCPSHLSMGDLFDAIVDEFSGRLTLQTLKKARREKAAWFDLIAQDLGCGGRRPQVATLRRALEASDDQFLIHDALWVRWHKRLESKHLGEILAGAV